MSAGLLPEVFLAFAYLLVPGVGLCVASRLTLGRSLLTSIAVAFGLGFAGVGLGSLLLVLVGVFAPITLLILWVVLTAAAWIFAARNGSPRKHLDGWRRHASADLLATVVTAAVVAGFGVVRWTVAPVANIAPTALRYWADAVEIADAGRLPKGTLQWGLVIEPTTSKVVLNAFNAGASVLLGRDPIEPAGALLFVVSIALMITAIALFQASGMVRLAPLGAILLFANALTGSELTTDLNFNLAEDWGRSVGLSAVLGAVVVLTRASGDVGEPGPDAVPPSPVLAAIVPGLLLGVAAGTHLVAAAAAIAMVCALALALMVVRRRVKAIAIRGGMILAAAAALGALVLVIPPGDLGFEGAGGTDRYRELRAELGLPPGFDPTRFIVTHDMDAAGESPEVGILAVGEAFAYRAIGQRVPNERIPAEELPALFLIGPTIVGLLLLVAAALRAPRDLATTMLWAAVFASVLFAVGVAFALRYDLFVLEVFGDRRLFTYALIPYVMIMLAAGEWALRSIGEGGLSRTRAVSGASLALVVVGALVFLPHATWAHASDRGSLEDQLQLLRWLGDHVPCEGRVLANRRTLGTFESIAGRPAILEGMGPHIRPSILMRAIEEISHARAFFREPRRRSDYLEQRGVAAVVIATSGNPFGGYPALGGGVRIHQLEDLEVLREAFGNPSGTVYLVEGFRPDPSLPTVAGRPGFGC
ncbi:MAG: hypothetical protein H0W97_00795 [Actinobacteria bacterium]|nr:hypothetical protein [Actinomycetota bacterium]